jgi:glycosyltransferase involved in cell wall biosynthesis
MARLISDDDASFWARSAVSAGVRVGRAAEVHTVLASGPPFSVLVAGARVAEQLGVPFIADMRDGWLTNPGTPSGGRRAERARRHQRLVMESANVVTCVSGPIAEEVTAAGASRVEVIPNGFDAGEMPAWNPVADATVRVGFMGRFYGLTDPAPFLRGLAEAAASSSGQALDVCLEVVGPPSERLDAVADALGVTEKVTHHGLLPHDEALALMARMDVGLVAIADVPGADAVYTTKLFEYLGMGLPVLVVGPHDGAAARLVRDVGAGWTVTPAETAAVAELLRGLSVEKRSAGRVTTNRDLSIIKTFERRAQAERIATILSEELRPTNGTGLS